MLEALLRGFLGIGFIAGVCYLLSFSRNRIDWPLVLKAFLAQVVIGVFVLKSEQLASIWTPLGYPGEAFLFLSRAFVTVLDFAAEGAVFVFGDLAKGPQQEGSMGFFFAFQVLPTIIFYGALTGVLYHLGIMQKIIQGFGWVMMKLLRTSGAESLCAAANTFIGLAEAPLTIRPYLASLTRSELFVVMTSGMATIAGGVMAAYIQMLAGSYAEVAGIPLMEAKTYFAAQLLGASVMAAPGAMLVSKMLIPETQSPDTDARVRYEHDADNLVDAAARGASDGLRVAVQVGAMLLAFIALIALANYLFELVGSVGGLNEWCKATFGKPLSLQLVLGIVFQGVAYIIGVPGADALEFGSLIGTKVILNEFVAYYDLAGYIAGGANLDPKTVVMASFALCGFANIGSLAILIGGVGTLVPERRKDISNLGMRSLLAGMLVTLMTATIAGMLFSL
ncbi:MAG: NupC/NupG family nucleoside CNT transporter [Ectothiorhodospiraceae bacterium]|nr:NupC/NupG family nucleoside CNT transporter [Ectothiorhodospiraceae bacterium]